MHKVTLQIYQDHYWNSSYGVTHPNTIDEQTPFTPFWDGYGIFHDVFEHYFEGKLSYFKDKFKMNIGGEIAAAGHAAYYRWGLNVDRFPQRDAFLSIRGFTLGAIKETILSGDYDYGDRLESCVPKQECLNIYDLNCLIDEHMCVIGEAEPDEEGDYMEAGKRYKRSCTENKIINLHYWGWRAAARLVGGGKHNRDKIENFIRVMNNFCGNYRAEDMLDNGYKYMHFTVGNPKDISISITLENVDGRIVSLADFEKD